MQINSGHYLKLHIDLVLQTSLLQDKSCNFFLQFLSEHLHIMNDNKVKLDLRDMDLYKYKRNGKFPTLGAVL